MDIFHIYNMALWIQKRVAQSLFYPMSSFQFFGSRLSPAFSSTDTFQNLHSILWVKAVFCQSISPGCFLPIHIPNCPFSTWEIKTGRDYCLKYKKVISLFWNCIQSAPLTTLFTKPRDVLPASILGLWTFFCFTAMVPGKAGNPVA